MHHSNNCLFWLLIALSIIISKVESEKAIKEYVERYSKDGGTNIIDSNEHVLKVSEDEDGILYEISRLLVCKGKYDDTPVAIKISLLYDSFTRESAAYQALNATDDPDVEKYGIPKVYYIGNAIDSEFKVIAMSLFEETISQRYDDMDRDFSDLSILLIFKQAVKTLQYLNSKQVKHNDIKPQNIFLRGTEVFIADFDLASLNATQGPGRPGLFSSANGHMLKDRFAMDDLETLIYSLWHVAGFAPREPFGFICMDYRRTGQIEKWLKKVCKNFKYTMVGEVFKGIFINEILSERQVPQYDYIFKLLCGIIDEVKIKSGQTEFDWLAKKPSKSNKLREIFSFGKK